MADLDKNIKHEGCEVLKIANIYKLNKLFLN